MLIEIILLLAGFGILIKGADFLVNGSSSIAKRFNISNLAIGLTVVSFGTSTPELIVSIFSAVEGKPDAALGNIVGSNNFNILFILGISGLIYPLVVQRSTVKYEVPLSILAALLLYLLVNDSIVWHSQSNMLSRLDALILITFFVLFMFYIYRTMKNAPETEQGKIKLYNPMLSVGMVILGLGMLVGGGKLVVDHALSIAHQYGLSEKLIGLTILAAGTSLPELATSAVAAYRRNTDIAIGNVVGSNIFNIFFILGTTAIIKPIPYNLAMNFDLEVLGVATIVLMVFMFTINQRKLDRWEAFLLLGGYLVYVTYLIAIDQNYARL